MAVFVGCAPKNLLMIAPPTGGGDTIHAVIENPTGSFEKWEVDASGTLVQERRDGVPLRIPEHPWPANAGMVPRTLLAEELGGDREPLDVLVLGDAIERGSLVRVIPIALLRVIDRLERDDKILAIMPDHPAAGIGSLEDLDAALPGLRAELTRWYEEARPGSAIEVQGFGTAAAARLLVAEGARAFEAASRSGTMRDWTAAGSRAP